MRLSFSRSGSPLGAIFGAIGVVVCIGVGLLHLDHLPVTLCPFKALTGLPCMTCGTTRALGRLYALDPAGALVMNPLAALAVLILVPWAITDAVLLPGGRSLSLLVSPREGRLVRVAAVSALLLNWAYLLAAGR